VKIGIGLPNTIPGTSGTVLVDWARRAEERGFSGLSTIDRIVYPSYDSLSALAVAAGATTRIGLVTNILLAPLYPPVLLAKASASVDQLSGGRLTLGLAPGGRADDYAAMGRDFDAGLDLLHRAWRGEPVAGGDKAVGPVPVHDARVPILIGGTSDRAVERAARWGDGWTSGGGGPDMAAPFVARIRAAWKEAGRAGEPRLAALAYYSLGDEVEADSLAALRDYYGFLPDYVEYIARGALRTEAAIRDAVRAFDDIGMTELYLDPTVARLDQVDRLADVVLPAG
jgi:alkanesulfonate monooxygenase SsuD/methylene tetrahydromethanopterin reductase-like flavin-dependent oxidoreductase (luciferase family)